MKYLKLLYQTVLKQLKNKIAKKSHRGLSFDMWDDGAGSKLIGVHLVFPDEKYEKPKFNLRSLSAVLSALLSVSCSVSCCSALRSLLLCFCALLPSALLLCCAVRCAVRCVPCLLCPVPCACSLWCACSLLLQH